MESLHFYWHVQRSSQQVIKDSKEGLVRLVWLNLFQGSISLSNCAAYLCCLGLLDGDRSPASEGHENSLCPRQLSEHGHDGMWSPLVWRQLLANQGEDLRWL